jgi:hypothetical protein
MGYLILKFGISAALLVAVSEIARRSSWLAALLASLPLTTLLAMVWMHFDGAPEREIAQLSRDVFWLVLASLPLFLLLAFLLERGWSFWVSLALCSVLTAAIYLGVCSWLAQGSD